MPLVFPSSASIGQTYQSGSSGVFVFNGEAWDSQAASVPIIASTAISASYAESSSLADASKLWFLHAFSNASYTIPGTFTVDVCRYNNINTQINTTGWFNTSNYRFTPQKSGYWEIRASYEIFRGSGVETSIRIRKNGTVIKYTGILGTVSVDNTTIVSLNGTTDYIDVVNDGANSSARTQTALTSIFQARWIGN
jgi:hypothetical protein